MTDETGRAHGAAKVAGSPSDATAHGLFGELPAAYRERWRDATAERIR
jgi:hypothetical protein